MALYSYKKEIITPAKKIVTAISYISMFAGFLFLFLSFYPVIASELYLRLTTKDIAAPIPMAGTFAPENSLSVLGESNNVSTNLVDYTKAAVWFPTAEADLTAIVEADKKISNYTISIPKIGIDDARVIVGGENLLASLVHYLPKTAPGELGNISIFGHSTLTQLHKKGDYKSIFTYLPTLQESDKIYVKYQGLTYEYEVADKFVVKPSQVEVLNQNFDGSFLTLVTCVPLGTYWNRLVVRARLTALPVN